METAREVARIKLEGRVVKSSIIRTRKLELERVESGPKKIPSGDKEMSEISDLMTLATRSPKYGVMVPVNGKVTVGGALDQDRREPSFSARSSRC